MSSKEMILSMLEEHRGTSVSGETLAGRLGVSRAAVWKAIEELRKEGHLIHATPRLGYSLSIASDILSEQGIRSHLRHADCLIRYVQQVDSTNLFAKRLALDSCEHGTIVVAGEQTSGRGRNGRSFFSPSQTGIYMSIVLKPSMDAMVAIRCTSAAALAVCRAIEDVCNISTQIKWVNDIIVNNKKVCGILTEGMAGLETGKIEYVILGIGVNVSTAPASFPPDVAQVATSLYDGVLPKGITRNRLIASITDHVLEIMEEVSSMNFLGEYRQRSIVLNREVEVSQGSVNYRAVATDIDDEGALVVRLRDGSLRRLNSGEITLRPAGSEHW